jgi:hypothetical protein
MSKEFWDERYSGKDFVYGNQPNVFFKEQLGRVKPGKLLLPCEGEGRNAVYAASMGWQVDAYDQSSVGMQKALQFAAQSKVDIHYTVKEIESIVLPENHYNAVGLIYAHLMPSIRSQFHKMCATSLVAGGVLILEAFEKSQLRNSSGGPSDLTMLYSVEEMLEDFGSLQIESCEKVTVQLNEGPYHQGTADLVRLVAIK